jgi:Rod binding domain-containing protein
MNVAAVGSQRIADYSINAAAPKPPVAKSDEEARKAFQSFVGQTFFGEMLKAMRKTQDKPAYFHGGRAEEIFQQQLDQVLAEKLAETSAASFSDPMYELFAAGRK